MSVLLLFVGAIVMVQTATVQGQSENVCDQQPCLNNGTCFSYRNYYNEWAYLCNCPPSYTGSNCETAVDVISMCDEFDSKRSIGGYIVSPNYPNDYGNGKYCTKTVFAPSEEFNRLDLESVHMDLESSYSCRFDYMKVLNRKYCGTSSVSIRNRKANQFTLAFRSDGSVTRSGFKVKYSFSIVNDPCDSGPCQNNGTCSSKGNSYTCSCPKFFKGMHCETKMEDPCYPVQSQFGTCGPYSRYCTSYYNSSTEEMAYRCHCYEGYTGRQCETRVISPCDERPCGSNGWCRPQRDYYTGTLNYRCYCRYGYTGRNCETREVNPCDDAPCINNGTCQSWRNYNSSGMTYRCNCPSGFTGRNCETAEIDPCDENPCGSNGWCHSRRYYNTRNATLDYRCYCNQGFTGMNCETIYVDPCANNPCGHNGTCLWDRGQNSTNPDYTCYCRRGHTGRNCETRFQPCDSQPCRNGGRCITVPYYNRLLYQCDCATGFRGRDCEIDLSEIDHESINICPSRTISASNGTIVSPNYPRNYPNNVNCELTIVGGVDNRYFSMQPVGGIYIEESRGCVYDYLAVDGLVNMQGRICGYIPTGQRVRSTFRNSVRIKFKSDSSRTYTGFVIKFQFANTKNGETSDEPRWTHGPMVKSANEPGWTRGPRGPRGDTATNDVDSANGQTSDEPGWQRPSGRDRPKGKSADFANSQTSDEPGWQRPRGRDRPKGKSADFANSQTSDEPGRRPPLQWNDEPGWRGGLGRAMGKSANFANSQTSDEPGWQRPRGKDRPKGKSADFANTQDKSQEDEGEPIEQDVASKDVDTAIDEVSE